LSSSSPQLPCTTSTIIHWLHIPNINNNYREVHHDRRANRIPSRAASETSLCTIVCCARTRGNQTSPPPTPPDLSASAPWSCCSRPVRRHLSDDLRNPTTTRVNQPHLTFATVLTSPSSLAVHRLCRERTIGKREYPWRATRWIRTRQTHPTGSLSASSLCMIPTMEVIMVRPRSKPVANTSLSIHWLALIYLRNRCQCRSMYSSRTSLPSTDTRIAVGSRLCTGSGVLHRRVGECTDFPS
jgi:hypothetical protein